MKKTIKRKAVIVLITLIGLVSIRWTFLQLETKQEVQHKLIFHNFLNSLVDAASKKVFLGDGTTVLSEFDSSWYPDTKTVFFDSTHIGKSVFDTDGKYIIRTIESSYYGSPGFISRYTEDIIGENYFSEEFENKFRDKLGLKPFAKIVIPANKEPWNFWSGAAIEKVFNTYYGGPKNKFQQVTYGYIYQVAAKNYMRDYIKILNTLLVENKSEWLKSCNIYYNKAMTDPNFNGLSESYKVAEKLINQQARLELKVIEPNLVVGPVGEIMRRQIDGSLPSILKCIKAILKDYDPKGYMMLKAS
jgi:hypothetical protein